MSRAAHCIRCGVALLEAWRHCPECGTRVGAYGQASGDELDEDGDDWLRQGRQEMFDPDELGLDPEEYDLDFWET